MLAYRTRFMLIALVYALPLAYNVGSAGGAPVYIAISTVSIVVFSAFIFLDRKVPEVSIVLIVFPLYFVFFGIMSSVFHKGSVGILFSTASFVIPLMHLPIGAWFALSRLGAGFSFRYFGFALLFVATVLVVSDFLLGAFPRGCGYEGRWGGCFGGWDTYGFPNPPMNFLGVGAALLGLLLIEPRPGRRRFLGISGIVLIGLLCFLSLSRSALLVYFISLAFILLATLGWRALVIIVPSTLLVFVFIDEIISSFLFTGTFARIASSVDAGDISTGRFGIWGEAFQLISQNPVFGAGFVSFSNFSTYGTVHQQYLEVVYKVGLLGTLIYFAPIVWGISAFQRSVRTRGDRKLVSKKRTLFYGFALGAFVANLFQPLISYQVFGNFVFFACGYFIATAADRLKHETNPPEPVHRAV